MASVQTSGVVDANRIDSDFDIHNAHLQTKLEDLETLIAQKEIDEIILKHKIIKPVHVPINIRLYRFVFSARFAELVIGFFIIVNAIFIGLVADYPDNRTLFWLEKVFNPIFTIEIIWKMIYFGWKRYLKDFWNWFDILVVAVGWVDVFVEFFVDGSSKSGLQLVRIFRILRIFRVFRLMRVNRELQLLVEGMWSSIRPLIGVLILIFITLFCASVFAIKIFEPKKPQSAILSDLFSNVPESMFTLLRVITLEGWASEIARPIDEDVPGYTWFFVIMIVIGSFGLLNILTAVFVEHSVAQAKEEEKRKVFELNESSIVEVSLLRKLLRDFLMYPPGFSKGVSQCSPEFTKKIDKLVKNKFIPRGNHERPDDEINANESDKAYLDDVDEQKLVLLADEFLLERTREETVIDAFDRLGVGVESANEVFSILDLAGCKVVNLEEFIAGCICSRSLPTAADIMKIEFAQRRRHCSFVSMAHHQQIAVDECRRRVKLLTEMVCELAESNVLLKKENLMYKSMLHESTDGDLTGTSFNTNNTKNFRSANDIIHQNQFYSDINDDDSYFFRVSPSPKQKVTHGNNNID